MGRKLPILFAGLMLGEEAMQSPYTSYPDIFFSEDMQIIYDNCWTGDDVLFVGYSDKDRHLNYGDRRAYEHVSK
jgi:hypothetical protein